MIRFSFYRRSFIHCRLMRDLIRVHRILGNANLLFAYATMHVRTQFRSLVEIYFYRVYLFDGKMRKSIYDICSETSSGNIETRFFVDTKRPDTTRRLLV